MQLDSGIFKNLFFLYQSIFHLLLEKRSCGLSEFQCNNGKCIPGSFICNSFNDCGDNSDESRTNGALCGKLKFFFFKNAIYFCKKLCMYVCVFARVSVHFHSREGLLLRVVDDNNFFRYDLRGLLISYQNQKTH